MFFEIRKVFQHKSKQLVNKKLNKRIQAEFILLFYYSLMHLVVLSQHSQQGIFPYYLLSLRFNSNLLFKRSALPKLENNF